MLKCYNNMKDNSFEVFSDLEWVKITGYGKTVEEAYADYCTKLTVKINEATQEASDSHLIVKVNCFGHPIK